MKSLPTSELRNLSVPELEQKRDAFVQELQQLRLKSKTIGVEKPAQFRRLRRGIARVLTIIGEQRRAPSAQSAPSGQKDA